MHVTRLSACFALAASSAFWLGACSDDDASPAPTPTSDGGGDALSDGAGGTDGGKAGNATGGASGQHAGGSAGTHTGGAGGSQAGTGGAPSGGSGGALTGGSGGTPVAGAGGAPVGGSGGSQTGGSGGAVARPSYNTGTGFFVVGGKLYDANGVEFRPRGVNKCHYDAPWPGIPKTHASAIRWGVPLWMSADVSAGLMQASIDQKIVPIAGVWYTAGTWADEDSVTCKEDVGHLNVAVDQWVAQAATFKPFEKYMLVNIANEWGPANSTVWRDAYVDAVAKLRAAGYLHTLVIDAGGCGQDPEDIALYAQDVFDSDPQKNIVFDQHIYGLWANGNPESWQVDMNPGLDKLLNTGLPILIGEFGPGRNIGPSPTMTTPDEIMAASEARGFGWLAWAWDDPAYGATDDGFALSFNGDYNGTADLTTYGKIVVEHPTLGLLQLGKPATVFP